MTTSLQQKYPWRATVRTVFQLLLALATMLPVVVAGAHIPIEGVVAWLVTASGVITRVMQSPAVEQFLQDHVGWLSAAPKAPPADDSDWVWDGTFGEPDDTQDDDGSTAPSDLPEDQRG